MASDIDFDELDRAVSSLLGDKNAPVADTKPADAVPVTSDYSTAPAPDTLSDAVAATPALPARPSQVVMPAARRSSGRFMDVRPVSRSSATDRPPTPFSTSKPVIPPAPAPAASIDWPDPIDFAANKTPAADTPVTDTPQVDEQPSDNVVSSDAAPNVAPEEPVVPADDTSTDNPPVDSLSSPFLPDAKVEKRPLGAFISPSVSGSGSDELMNHNDEVKLNAPTEITPASDTDSSAANEPDAPVLPVVDSDTPMPAELQEDVLSLESDEVKAPTQPTPGSPSQPLGSSVVPDASSMDDNGPTSIVQQYKEKQPTETPPSGAIYDTEAYHKPIVAKKPSKKRGWMVVVWILLLIILGAGAGAAVYFFVLPLLQ